MGAPAISTRTRPARPAPKGRPAKARPKAAPKAKPKPRAGAPAAAPRRAPAGARASTSPRSQPRGRSGSAAQRSSRRPLAAGPGGVAALPIAAVGRTADAVSGLADCGVVIGMTRSRAWIAVLGVLLGGIVAVNVWGLSLSAAGSGTAVKIDSLQRENSVLRGRIAKRLSNDRIEQAAAKLGLAVPAPDAITYLKAEEGDAAKAAKRLAGGEISAAAPAATAPAIDPATGLPLETVSEPYAVEPATVEPATAPVDPVTGTPVDPAAVDPAVVPIDPAAG